MGAPCCTKHAVCFRSLAELTIEKPPISSTSTLTFVCGGPLLEPPRVSSSLSELEPDAALARFRDGPPLVLPRGGGGGGCGATVFLVFVFAFVFVFFFAFFFVALELLLDDDDPEPLAPPSDPYPSQSGIEIQPSSRYTLFGEEGMFEGRWPDLLHTSHYFWLFSLSFRTIALATAKGSMSLAY